MGGPFERIPTKQIVVPEKGARVRVRKQHGYDYANGGWQWQTHEGVIIGEPRVHEPGDETCIDVRCTSCKRPHSMLVVQWTDNPRASGPSDVVEVIREARKTAREG